MMTGPLSSAVSPGILSSIPLGSARSPRSSLGVDGSSLFGSGPSAFSASGGLLSGSAALPDLKDFDGFGDLGLGWWIGVHL